MMLVLAIYLYWSVVPLFHAHGNSKCDAVTLYPPKEYNRDEKHRAHILTDPHCIQLIADFTLFFFLFYSFDKMVFFVETCNIDRD